MSVDSFEKTNWGWQFSQLQQQVGEWLEYQFSRFNSTLPEWSLGSSTASWLSKLLNLLFWILLSLFLVWVGWQFWQKFSPYLDSWRDGVRKTTVRSAKTTVAELSGGVWLARSQEFYRRGNYREACRCLYFAMLQYLDFQAILPNESSRTDGEYLQLLRLSVTPMQPYETLITTHEQICFSDTDIYRENYEQCQQAYREIANS